MAKAFGSVLGFFLCGALLSAGPLKTGKLKPGANPPNYAAFNRPLSEEDQLRHALDRLTFGPRPGDLERLDQMGLKRWLDEQLHPEKIAENSLLIEKLSPLTSLNLAPPQTYALYESEKSAGQKGPNPAARDLIDAKILRAIYSNRQFAELLDDFWFNHFNVFLNKGADRYFLAVYERDTIRPHLFGKFYDLLLATAESPAMLFYLDNWQSAGPDLAVRAPNNKRARRGLNENYGRELLELHTLGVNGGYMQKDVIEVARCFTGWTIRQPGKGGEFFYSDRLHDKGAKVVLGHVIPAGGGMKDGLEVLEILAHHPATAHHISLELAQRFVADDPPPSLVNRMSETFLKSGGDLRKVLQTMLKSPEFWSEGAYQAKVKTPFEMVVSAVRAANANVDSANALAGQIQKLGEPLYRKIEPTGYSSANTEWINSASLLDRMNFALALAQNRVKGVHVDTGSWESQRDPLQVARSILGALPGAQTEAAIEQQGGAPNMVAGLTLGSPEFQRR
ncbi:MAG TPA: DUF1800 domain-containing protein [Bryobacteraceae bacterium]|nr:DUF1800 domain-containing protein [Bryobacteraceae bacterium]